MMIMETVQVRRERSGSFFNKYSLVFLVKYFQINYLKAGTTKYNNTINRFFRGFIFVKRLLKSWFIIKKQVEGLDEYGKKNIPVNNADTLFFDDIFPGYNRTKYQINYSYVSSCD